MKSTPNYGDNQERLAALEAWPRVVGPKAARHSWALKLFDDGCLLVAASSHAWLTSLRYLEPQILAKYERELRDKRVTSLRFKITASAP